MKKIFLPTVEAMKKEGRMFRGCLYFGLMLTKDGPKVIEYNCRFGDPETQVVLPLLETDLLTVMQAVSSGKLSSTQVKFKNKSACCVVIASEGYPTKYETGFEITLPETDENSFIFVAGAAKKGEKLVSSSGRVLGVTCTADTLGQAVNSAYTLAGKVGLENAFYRKDIGKKALSALED